MFLKIHKTFKVATDTWAFSSKKYFFFIFCYLLFHFIYNDIKQIKKLLPFTILAMALQKQAEYALFLQKCTGLK